MDSKRLDALTGVRFIAALHVLWFHFGPAPAVRWLANLRGCAQIEVPFFLVLSGFVLTYRHAGRPLDRRAFYQARFARLYPLLALSILVALFALFVAGGVDRQIVTIGAAQLLGVHSWIPSLLWGVNDPSWSVSVEAAFYVMFPFLFERLFRGGPRRILASMILWWVLGNALTALGLHLRPEGQVDVNELFLFSPVSHLPAFMVGIGAGHLFVRDRAEGRARNGTMLTLIAMIAIATFVLSRDRLPNGEWFWAYTHNSLVVPALALFIFGLAHGGPIADLFAQPRLSRLGDASYALYLFQAPLSLVIHGCFVRDWETLPLAQLQLLAILVPLSLLLHDLVERPMQKWLLARFAGQGKVVSERART